MIDKLLLEHVGLHHELDLTVHLDNFLAHVILVSAQVLLVLTLGLWTLRLQTQA